MLVITAAAAPPVIIINGITNGEHLVWRKDLINTRCYWLLIFFPPEPNPLFWAPGHLGWSL